MIDNDFDSVIEKFEWRRNQSLMRDLYEPANDKCLLMKSLLPKLLLKEPWVVSGDSLEVIETHGREFPDFKYSGLYFAFRELAKHRLESVDQKTFCNRSKSSLKKIRKIRKKLAKNQDSDELVNLIDETLQSCLELKFDIKELVENFDESARNYSPYSQIMSAVSKIEKAGGDKKSVLQFLEEIIEHYWNKNLDFENDLVWAMVIYFLETEDMENAIEFANRKFAEAIESDDYSRNFFEAHERLVLEIVKRTGDSVAAVRSAGTREALYGIVEFLRISKNINEFQRLVDFVETNRDSLQSELLKETDHVQIVWLLQLFQKSNGQNPSEILGLLQIESFERFFALDSEVDAECYRNWMKRYFLAAIEKGEFELGEKIGLQLVENEGDSRPLLYLYALTNNQEKYLTALQLETYHEPEEYPSILRGVFGGFSLVLLIFGGLDCCRWRDRGGDDVIEDGLEGEGCESSAEGFEFADDIGLPLGSAGCFIGSIEFAGDGGTSKLSFG